MDVGAYMSEDGAKEEGNRTKYELYGVVNHAGSMEYGHYTAFVSHVC